MPAPRPESAPRGTGRATLPVGPVPPRNGPGTTRSASEPLRASGPAPLLPLLRASRGPPGSCRARAPGVPAAPPAPARPCPARPPLPKRRRSPRGDARRPSPLPNLRSLQRRTAGSSVASGSASPRRIRPATPPRATCPRGPRAAPVPRPGRAPRPRRPPRPPEASTLPRTPSACERGPSLCRRGGRGARRSWSSRSCAAHLKPCRPSRAGSGRGASP